MINDSKEWSALVCFLCFLAFLVFVLVAGVSHLVGCDNNGARYHSNTVRVEKMPAKPVLSPSVTR